MASKRPGVLAPSRDPKVSRGRRALRGRLEPGVCTPIPATRRYRNIRTASSTATTALGLPVAADPQQDRPLPPHTSDGRASLTSSGSPLVATKAASNSPSSYFDEDEVETMRGSVDREDRFDSVTDGSASCSFVVEQEAGCHRDAPTAKARRGRGGATSQGPFNSTMVEDGVPIHQMPLPGVWTGSRVSTVAEAEDETAVVSPPLPSPPPPTDVIPPCPLGLYRQMQLREMRRHGVRFSWELPR